MSSFILVPYYNIIPNNELSYFTILDNTLIVSLTDVFGNSSNFLANNFNRLIYIFNGPNMGSFTVTSLQTTTNKSFTLSIILNSVPPNLTDNTYCVLSLYPSAYAIERIYTNSIVDNINGNFTITGDNTILINKSSSSSDDTLFIYILITNKSFNIYNDISSVSYFIDDVVLSKNQVNNSYISINATIPIISLINGSSYEFSISTDKSSTVTKTIYTPGYTPAVTTTAPIPQVNNLNVNMIENQDNKKTLDFNYNVLLTFKSNEFYGNGYFSLKPKLPTNTNEHFSYPTNMTDAFNIIKGASDKYYNDVKTSSINMIYNQVQPDKIPYVSIINGPEYTLSISAIDSFKKPVNFINQYSLFFLTSGIDMYMIATNTFPVHTRSGSESIIECDIVLDKLIPSNINNKSFVLSKDPISPYVTFEYVQTHIISDVIGNGLFTILPISGSNKSPTLILSNREILYNNEISSFNNLLYTIIQDPTKELSPPYLNILNVDYSIVCTLAVLHVSQGANQTTLTYSVVAGADNLFKLNNKTNYIFTMLKSSDFTSDEGIINNTLEYRRESVKYNTVIQRTKNVIDRMIISDSNDSDLINARNIMRSTVSQNNTLLQIPIIASYKKIINSLIINTFNALQYMLKVDYRNSDISSLLNMIDNLEILDILLIKFEYISTKLNESFINNPRNNSDIRNAIAHVDSVINTLKTPNANINRAEITQTALSNINKALVSNPLDVSLIKSKNILSNSVTLIPERMTSSENNVGRLIEKLDNVNSNVNNTYYIIMVIILLILLIYIIHTYSVKK